MHSAKTDTDVHYEITPRTQQSISRWIHAASLEASSFCFQVVDAKGDLAVTHFIVRLSGVGL